jgi:hypothetical protein
MSDIPPSSTYLDRMIHQGVKQPVITKYELEHADFMKKIHKQIDYFRGLLIENGLVATPWSRELGWRNDENPSDLEFHDEQELAALEIFYKFYIEKKSLIHLVAEMQSGKTGVMSCFIRLVKANPKVCGVNDDGVFIITGMNDTDWGEQTKKRIPYDWRSQVEYNAGLGKIKESMNNAYKNGRLANNIVINDESHYAGDKKNRPYKEIYAHIESLSGPGNDLNIKYLSVSATDPAGLVQAKKAKNGDVVRLQAGPDYLSVKSLYQKRHILQAKDLSDSKNMNELHKFIYDYNLENTYIFIRTRGAKHTVIKGLIKEKFKIDGEAITDKNIIEWDQNNRPLKINLDKKGKPSKMTDINEIVREKPNSLTFVLIKDKLRAAKTIDTTYIGILYDSVSDTQTHDTALQSFIGRACGRKKNANIYVFGNIEAVQVYIEFWSKIETIMKETENGNYIVEIDEVAAEELNTMMKHFGAKETSGGDLVIWAQDKKGGPSMAEDSGYKDPRATVPLIRKVEKELIDSLLSCENGGRVEILLEYLKTIKGFSISIIKTLKSYKNVKFSHPGEGEINYSYKRHITNIIENSNKGKTDKGDIPSEYDTQNCWTAFIDSIENRIVICIWHGTKKSV